jgi:streptogramin lyase
MPTIDAIARITTAGVVTVFTGATISRPEQIVAAPDGNLWFTNTGTKPSIG